MKSPTGGDWHFMELTAYTLESGGDKDAFACFPGSSVGHESCIFVLGRVAIIWTLVKHNSEEVFIEQVVRLIHPLGYGTSQIEPWTNYGSKDLTFSLGPLIWSSRIFIVFEPPYIYLLRMYFSGCIFGTPVLSHQLVGSIRSQIHIGSWCLKTANDTPRKFDMEREHGRFQGAIFRFHLKLWESIWVTFNLNGFQVVPLLDKQIGMWHLHHYKYGDSNSICNTNKSFSQYRCDVRNFWHVFITYIYIYIIYPVSSRVFDLTRHPRLTRRNAAWSAKGCKKAMASWQLAKRKSFLSELLGPTTRRTSRNQRPEKPGPF